MLDGLIDIPFQLTRWTISICVFVNDTKDAWFLRPPRYVSSTRRTSCHTAKDFCSLMVMAYEAVQNRHSQELIRLDLSVKIVIEFFLDRQIGRPTLNI